MQCISVDDEWISINICSDQEIERKYSFMFLKYLFDYIRSLKDLKTANNTRSNNITYIYTHIYTYYKNIRFIDFWSFGFLLLFNLYPDHYVTVTSFIKSRCKWLPIILLLLFANFLLLKHLYETGINGIFTLH